MAPYFWLVLLVVTTLWWLAQIVGVVWLIVVSDYSILLLIAVAIASLPAACLYVGIPLILHRVSLGMVLTYRMEGRYLWQQPKVLMQPVAVRQGA